MGDVVVARDGDEPRSVLVIARVVDARGVARRDAPDDLDFAPQPFGSDLGADPDNTSFTATPAPERRSRARKTVPNPPDPMAGPSSYRPPSRGRSTAGSYQRSKRSKTTLVRQWSGQTELRALDADPMRIAGLKTDENAKPCDQRVVFID